MSESGGCRETVAPPCSTLTGSVTVQMARHGLALVSSEADASPTELLGVVRILASTPVLDDRGAAAEAQRVAAGISAIRFAYLPGFSHEPPVRAPLRETETNGDYRTDEKRPVEVPRARVVFAGLNRWRWSYVRSAPAVQPVNRPSA